ncbi:RNA-directed DNA polymerase, eukaryota, reverse transcriptase zinc-binding domain protein [Tanacetum coccineum]
MINLIMTCVSSASFSIFVNEDRHGYFKGGRGLRQGDLISPYVFTMVMELKISYLCFADDLLIPCHEDVNELRLSSLDHFCNMSGMWIEHGEWKWPLKWRNRFNAIANLLVPHLDSNNADSTVWITNKGIKCKFSTNKACNDLKESGEEVQWWKIVWFNHCIPRHAFILWLAIQGRLSTHDRLLKWYPDKVVVCPLYEECPDSQKHLERNKRLFAAEKKDWETVHNEVINTIRFKLSSVKIKSSLHVNNIEKTWKIKMNVQSNDEVIIKEQLDSD